MQAMGLCNVYVDFENKIEELNTACRSIKAWSRPYSSDTGGAVLTWLVTPRPGGLPGNNQGYKT